MVDAQRHVGVVIESTQSTKDLAIRHVVRVLGQLQNSLYHIGEYLSTEDFRARGPPDDRIRDKCEMVFKEVSKGSFNAELVLQDPQTTLTGQASLGEDSLQKLGQIITEINNEDAGLVRIKESIEDPRHLYRIIGDINGLWPGDGDGFKVTFRGPNMTPLTLHPSRKFFIGQLLKGENEEREYTVRGVISYLDIKKDKLKIDGPDGVIKIPYDSLEQVKDFLNKPIAISGKAETDATGNISELTSVFGIELFKHTTIKRVLAQKGELQLSKPLIIDIDYRNKNWIMKNDAFRIMVHDGEYSDCLKQFNDELFFIWSEYGPVDDARLSSDARSLKKRVLSLVKEQPIS